MCSMTYTMPCIQADAGQQAGNQRAVPLNDAQLEVTEKERWLQQRKQAATQTRLRARAPQPQAHPPCVVRPLETPCGWHLLLSQEWESAARRRQHLDRPALDRPLLDSDSPRYELPRAAESFGGSHVHAGASGLGVSDGFGGMMSYSDGSTLDEIEVRMHELAKLGWRRANNRSRIPCSARRARPSLVSRPQ